MEERTLKITKAGEVLRGAPAAEELAAVNTFAKAELGAEEVYCFSVMLCDNEVDRDFERFTEKTLGELSELFVGKTGIADHDWSADRQCARIYRCEVVTDPVKKNSQGMPYMWLKGRAYMLRTEGNAELIAQIDGGIKKETSVGCSVAKTVCSICGEELGTGKCSHIKGRTYSGKLCCGELTGAVDAYEWSFVAVPAQRGAGVVKARRRDDAELERLKAMASLGEKYLEEKRAEVLRLGLICDRSLGAALKSALSHMDAEELEGFRKAFAARAAEKLPLTTQLPGKNEVTAFSGEEYKV